MNATSIRIKNASTARQACAAHMILTALAEEAAPALAQTLVQ